MELYFSCMSWLSKSLLGQFSNCTTGILYYVLCIWTGSCALYDMFDITSKNIVFQLRWAFSCGGARVRFTSTYHGHIWKTCLMFDASRSGRWKSWHSTLWHHQNTTPSQHSAALMAVLKGTFKNTELQVAAGMVCVFFAPKWTWMKST